MDDIKIYTNNKFEEVYDTLITISTKTEKKT